MKKIIADTVYPITAPPIERGMLVLDKKGKIIDILNPNDANYSDSDAEILEGFLCPGFVNTHCHLELSYLLNAIPQKTGLIGFVSHIQKVRNQFSEEQMLDAIQQADSQMQESGIVAVGDISNASISKTTKQNSAIFYHTFVEVFGFLPERASAAFENALQVCQDFSPLSASVTTHAPYSVSPELFRLVQAQNPKWYSIHNQETLSETTFFKEKEGDWLQFYERLNMDISHFSPTGKSSLQTVSPMFPPLVNKLLVHNTFTQQEDLDSLAKDFSQYFFALCPKANLYIEDTLPNVDLLRQNNCKITIGTDSLASNDTLSVWEELKVLKNNFPDLTWHELLSWASINGAEFLGIQDHIGSFDKGKKPGVNWVNERGELSKIA